MLDWHWAVALLIAAWLLQGVGTFVQMERFRAAFRQLSGEWSDGWLGAGKAGGGLRRGAAAMLVVAPNGAVRRVVVIEGRTVFAKARRLERFEGLPVSRVEADARGAGTVGRAVLAALAQAQTARANAAGLPAASPA